MFGTVHDLGPLPGIAELAESVGAVEPTKDAATALVRAIEESELPLEGVMGFRDRVRSMIDWLSGRHLVRKLAPVTVPLLWFECHAPHNGSVRMKIAQSRGSSYAVGFKVFGSGYGRGRHFGVKVTQESGRRTTCADYIVDVRAIPMVYSKDGIESVVLDLVADVGLRVVARRVCPYCGKSPDELDPVEYALGQPIDLREDDNDTRWKTDVRWARARKLNAAVSVPQLSTALSIEAAITSELLWKLSYKLRSGVLYQPYHRISDLDLLPPMWAFRSASSAVDDRARPTQQR
jgi:hypothetical protein